jgi:DNA-binding response OmpR family regulator
MKGNVLVIDESGAAASLLELLTASGYHCFHARGPLKVRGVLDSQSIDLIVWREHGGNPALTRDLAREWESHPEIPIVHLYPNRPPRFARSADRTPHESIPAEAAATALVPVIDRVLARSGTAGQPGALQHTELAFRNVLSRLRATWSGRAEPKTDSRAAESLPAPGTALDPIERELLFASRPAPVQATGAIRKLLARLRPLRQ